MTGRPTTEEALAAVGVARNQRELADAAREFAEVTATERPEPKPRTRLFRGSLNGRDVLVTLHDPEGYGEIAMREGEGRWARWGVPSELTEEL